MLSKLKKILTKKTLFIFLIIAFVLNLAFTFNFYNQKIKLKKRIVNNRLAESIKVQELKKNIDFLTSQNKVLEKDLIETQQNKYQVNKKKFPQTQFLELNYNEVYVNGINYNYNSYRDGKSVKSFYIELFNNFVLISSKLGKFYYFDIDKIYSGKPAQQKIKSNIEKFGSIEVLDLLADQNFLYVSIHSKDMECQNTIILRSKINLKKLNFEKFFSSGNSGQCDKSYIPIGGRLDFYKHNGKKGILTLTTHPSKKNYFLPEGHNSHEYIYASLMFIDIDIRKEIPFSSGIRNPLGLLTNSKNIILFTENGPRGGDEINKAKFEKNYGWPIVSYGENYFKNFKETDSYEFKKDHKSLGFEEPIYSFVPSVAPTQIVELDNNFSKKWSNNYVMGSLRSQSLFRIKFDEKFEKIIFIEQIFINRRVRDLIYDSKNGIIFLSQEDTGSLGILSVKK